MAILNFENNGVNNPSGTRLLDANNNPVRASLVKVYCPRVRWFFDSNVNSLITEPTGNGQTSDGTFNFPGLLEYSVVLFQEGGFREVVNGTSPETAQTFQVSNGSDLGTNVNDQNNAPNDYPDNSGAYDLVVEVLQS